MATQKGDEKHQKGVIKDQDEDVRYDSGEALKDQYERADAYEKDRIELRGIVFFVLGLVLLCGVTFGLMRLLQGALEEQAVAGEKGQKSPMMMTREENLPPEPRLQAAPGFGVDEENGRRVNLELREPQSEYRVLQKQWQDVWANGRKDPHTGAEITMPMAEAKEKVIQENLIKTRPAEQAEQAAKTVRLVPSYQSSGRDNDIRRQ